MRKMTAARAALTAFLLVAVLTGSALAEIPDDFTNLKIFAKDIGKRELVNAMRTFSLALGVRCEHCHLQKTPGDFDSIDWASDENPKKDITRGMMTMMGSLNGELLPNALGSRESNVRCVTCHRGLENPATLDRVLLDTIANKNVDAGLLRYRDLREDYYGQGSYDFGPMTLTGVAEALAQQMGDPEGAMKVLDLNTEMNPEHAMSYLMKAQLQVLEGDKEGAIANTRKVLELDPENRLANRLLEQLAP